MRRQTVFITGATAGIGRATAEEFAKHGAKLILTGRRELHLDDLEKRLKKKYQTTVFAFACDVRDRLAVERHVAALPASWKKIDVLVNNAGLALEKKPIQEGSVEDWEVMIDTNIKGLLYVSHAVIPLMIRRRAGQIINIGSLAGREMYPSGNVYAMTKHAVVALSKGMRYDLVGQGIKVTVVNPGHVSTEFANVRYRGDAQKVADAYRGFTTLRASDVARGVFCGNPATACQY